MSKDLRYTLFERIADSWQMDQTEDDKWTEAEVLAMMSDMCSGLERYTIEVNCEAVVLWIDNKIAAVALNDNGVAEVSDAEDYLRKHEERDD